MNNIYKKKVLLYYAYLIPITMIIIFSFISHRFGKTIGYFLPYTIYLIILLCGVTLFKTNKKENYEPITNHKAFYYILAFIPVVPVFFVAFLPTLPFIKIDLLLLLLGYSLLNGTLEELFWRVTFNKAFGNNMMLSYIVPTTVFSCWHFALLCASGVNYHGGALALVGGAGVMGAIWGIVLFKSKNAGVVITAHVLANFFAFSQLLYQNWFV